jgi:hypothetical protein
MAIASGVGRAARAFFCTVLANVTRIHEEQERFWIICQEHLTLQTQKPLIDASRPFMLFLWLFKLLFKMKDSALTVIAKEVSAFVNGQCIRRTARVFSVFFAAKHAFHSYPVSSYNVLRVNPSKIFEAVFSEQFFQLLSITHLHQLLGDKHYHSLHCSNNFACTNQ